MEKEENASEEAFNAAALSQFFSRPGWWQAGTVLLVLGIPGDDGYGTKYSMNPGNETQAPICRIQANDTGTNLVEVYSPF
jgi:hypothetical protein